MKPYIYYHAYPLPPRPSFLSTGLGEHYGECDAADPEPGHRAQRVRDRGHGQRV